ncbi:LacI family DNA-binding transcriptional regulator [Tropicimonas sediminicola]|uniref:Transcriptional regulator, LacI family n=1 Tax=Tropicimonas sediminicola TaxID=1031541 RepID=A0A239J0W5_9RHOB|nr:LacI family DNA-binding transcriptional regulator [Tropicimonas sediminicola]SNS99405.1 transcriptional regulator, LacI family [Tropicimonas sediminicola]
MTRKATMKDVARAAGVAPMTVSRAFKSNASVNAETRAKVMEAAEALGYVFDSAASNLRSRKSGFVAAIIPSLNNANFADTIGAMSKVLEREGLQILLGYTSYSIEEEERLIEKLLRRSPEAIVLTGGHHTERARKLLDKATVPIVETWDLPEHPIEHVVGFSNSKAMKGLVDHLVDKGFTKIAFLGGDASADLRGQARLIGFIEALEQHGLDTSRLIAAGPAPVAMREGALAMEHLLKAYPDTEAVVCVSDLTAFGALTECQRRGIRVPEDISIAGFGAYDISAFAHPTITTIEAFSAEIGRKTGQLIARLLRGDDPPEGPQCEEISPQLVVRQSTP